MTCASGLFGINLRSRRHLQHDRRLLRGRLCRQHWLGQPAVHQPTAHEHRGQRDPRRQRKDRPARHARADGAAAGQLNGTIISLDLLPMEPIAGVQFIQGDFREDAVLAQLEAVLQGRPVDVVVSDMAPNLSGHSSTDAARVGHLIELAIDFASRHLRPGGALVTKVFHGPGYDALVQLFRAHFAQVKPLKPLSSRAKSTETFLIGRTLKHPMR